MAKPLLRLDGEFIEKLVDQCATCVRELYAKKVLTGGKNGVTNACNQGVTPKTAKLICDQLASFAYSLGHPPIPYKKFVHESCWQEVTYLNQTAGLASVGEAEISGGNLGAENVGETEQTPVPERLTPDGQPSVAKTPNEIALRTDASESPAAASPQQAAKGQLGAGSDGHVAFPALIGTYTDRLDMPSECAGRETEDPAHSTDPSTPRSANTDSAHGTQSKRLAIPRKLRRWARSGLALMVLVTLLGTIFYGPGNSTAVLRDASKRTSAKPAAELGRDEAAHVDPSGDGKWIALPGAYQLTSTEREIEEILVFGSRTFADYDFEVVATSPSGGAFGVVFRYSDEGDFLFWTCGWRTREMDDLPWRGTKLAARIDGSYMELADDNGQIRHPILPVGNRDAPVAIKVSVRGTACTCWIDGEKVLAVNRLPVQLDRGRVGLFFKAPDKKVCVFSNIKLTDPKGQDLLPGLPAQIVYPKDEPQVASSSP